MRLISWLVMTATFAPASVSATNFPPATYDCTAPVGAFTAFRQSWSAPNVRVAGTMRADTAARTPRWRPTVAVMVRTTDKQGFVFLRLVQEEGQKDFSVVIERQIRGQKSSVTVGQIPAGTDVAFEVNGNPAGKIEASFAGKTTQVDLGAAVTSIEFGCSTGDFEFNTIVIGDGG